MEPRIPVEAACEGLQRATPGSLAQGFGAFTGLGFRV